MLCLIAIAVLSIHLRFIKSNNIQKDNVVWEVTKPFSPASAGFFVSPRQPQIKKADPVGCFALYQKNINLGA